MEKKFEDYPKPSVTADIVIFSVREGKLKVLLVKRGIEPFKNKWAIPGGFVQIDESLEHAAKRELEEETGVKADYLEQLYTFGDLKRDPRGRVLTIAYFALMKSDKLNLKPSTDVIETEWVSAYSTPELAFDHKKILEYAIKRLKWKLEYTNVAFSLLPDKFTMSEVQDLYEIILNKHFDKRNFRKKILSLNLLKKEEIKRDVSFRPPQLYSLKKKLGEIVEII